VVLVLATIGAFAFDSFDCALTKQAVAQCLGIGIAHVLAPLDHQRTIAHAHTVSTVSGIVCGSDRSSAPNGPSDHTQALTSTLCASAEAIHDRETHVQAAVPSADHAANHVPVLRQK